MKNQVMFDRAPVHAIVQRRRLINCGTAWLTAGARLLAAWAALALLDVKYAWSEPLRLGLAVLTGAAFLAVLTGRWRMGRKGNDCETVIRNMEAANPAGGQQLRTAWEVAEKGAPARSGDPHAGFTRKLLRDAQLQVQGNNWSRLAPSRRLVGWFAVCAAVAAGVFAMAQQSPDLKLALRRIVLPSGAPTFTQVAWSVTPSTFDDRHPPRLAVTLSGRQAEPRLEVLAASSRQWENRPLTALADGRTYDIVLTGLTGDFQARVIAGDGSTPTHPVHYRPIPRLEESKVTVTFPDYTGRAPEERPGADVQAVEGSTLAWQFVFNTPPDRVEWKLAAGTMEPVSLPVEKSGNAVTAKWQAPRGEFSGVLTVYDTDGSTVDSWKYAIAGVPDALPRVELLEPVKDREATSVTELPVRIRARDDFGVSEIGLIMEAAGQTIWTMEKVIAEKDHVDVSELTRAMLETVPLTIRDNVKLYAYALDHKPRGGPRAVSGLRAIDIRDFKKRERYLGKQKGPPVSPEQVVKLNELIMAQRVVVSDCHIIKEEARDELADGIPRKCQETDTREAGVVLKTTELFTAWQKEPTIPRDDLTLLGTARMQMLETQRYLGRVMPDQSHISSDRALTTLIQIRKHLMKLIMESDTPCDCETDCPSDLKDLEAFAKEAERLANEEKSVREQITPDLKKEIASLDSSRRQQEVAGADAGELFAEMVKHPKKNDGMERLMAAAETVMREADSQLHSDDYLTSMPRLAEGEQTLRDLADFIRAMNEDKLAETLAQMANKAKGDAKKAGEKKDGGESEEPTALAGTAKKPGSSGASGSGKSAGEGEASGDSPSDSPAAGDAAAKEAARNTALADAILKALEERAGEAGKAEEGEEEKPGSGMSADALAALRERLGTEALARELKESADSGQPGSAPGNSQGQGGDFAGRLDNMSKELTAEAMRLKASRLARLADMRSKAVALQKKAAADKAVQDAEQEKKLIAQYIAMGIPPGASVQVNGKMITIPQPGEPGGKPGSGESPGSGDKPGNAPGQGVAQGGGNGRQGGMGPALGRFAVEAQELNDEPVTGWAMQLGTEVPELIVPALDGIVQRLDVLIAALPGGAQPVTAHSRVPEANRREVEAYFRNLSDDFGDEQ